MKLEDLEMKNSHPRKFLYQIDLRDPLQPEHSVPVKVGSFILNYELTPHCKEILRKEKQLVIKYTMETDYKYFAFFKEC